MNLHEHLRDLVARQGPSVVDTAETFRAALDDFLSEDEATTGELNLLVDAVRLGAVVRLRSILDHGGTPQAAVEEAGKYSAFGILASTQPRHWAQAWPWVEIRRTSPGWTPGRAARTNVIATSSSLTIRSGSPTATASRVALTPPSTEFSIGTMAASTAPDRTSASAAPTVATGRRRASAAPGTWSRAASVKVPSGPR